MFRPNDSPWPLNEDTDVRLALSKEDLKIYWTDNSEHIISDGKIGSITEKLRQIILDLQFVFGHILIELILLNIQ